MSVGTGISYLKQIFTGAALAALVACAPGPLAEDGVVKQGASFVRLSTPVTAPADFVREARPKEELTYLPVGVTPPKREIAPRNPAGVIALEAELDAQRNAARSFANRPAPPPTYDGSKPPKVKPPPPELLPQ